MSRFQDPARQLRFIASRLIEWGLKNYARDLLDIAEDIDARRRGVGGVETNDYLEERPRDNDA